MAYSSLGMPLLRMGYVRGYAGGGSFPGVTGYRGKDRCCEALQTNAAAAAAACSPHTQAAALCSQLMAKRSPHDARL